MLKGGSLLATWAAIVAVLLVCCLWPAGLGLRPSAMEHSLDDAYKGYMTLLQQQQQQQQPISVTNSLKDPQFSAAQTFPSLQLPLVPQPAWLSQCCMSKKLRELYLPGTHDSGTAHPWTVPHHLPFVFDEMASVLFNIVGDLSRTQHHTVYEQLQAGARVLDLRLAVNPWLPLEHRARNTSSRSRSSSTTMPGMEQQQPSDPLQDSKPAPLFTLNSDTLQSSINYAAVGGPLTAAELSGAVVISHSLPGVRLSELLGDVRRFLAEQPTEVLTILVKGDTVDVNVAATQRMTPAAWAAAADTFRRELPGVQLLTQFQVEQQTLAELVSAGPLGSVLVYSSELQQAGLTALSSHQLEILESWGNGTDTEDVPTLKDKIISWMQFWHDAGWRQNEKPYMLLASAEVTLGVKTILKLLKNRVWLVKQQQQQQQQQQQGCAVASTRQKTSIPADNWHAHAWHPQSMSHPVACHQQRPPGLLHQWLCQLLQQQGLVRQRLGVLHGLCPDQPPVLGVMRTLYDMGAAANQQLLQEVLMNDQVLKTFNIWSLDALSSDIVSVVIQLNTAPISS